MVGKPVREAAELWMVFEPGERPHRELLYISSLSDRVKRLEVQTALDLLEAGALPDLVLLQGRPGKRTQRSLRMLKEKAPALDVLLVSRWEGAEEMRRWMADSVKEAVQPAREPEGPLQNPYELSHRETEVLQLMARGLIKKEIAEQLSISYHTIVHHERSIFEKLNVHTRSAAVAKALMERLC